MATEDLLVTAKLDVPAAGLPDISELPSASLANIPPEALSKAFGIPGRGRSPMDTPCPPGFPAAWPWSMESLMALQQMQAAAFAPTGILPFGGPGFMPPAFGTNPANFWAFCQAQALREAGMPQPGSFYGPMAAGAAQIGAGGPWGSGLPDKSPILQGGGRVPVSQGAPGWYPYPASRPGPGGGAALPGSDYNNNAQGCNGAARRDGEPQPVQRARMVWTQDLHQRFLEAVQQIGVDQAVPKKIMQVMKVDYLTRENVASHLQKYRLQLKREQESKSGTARRNRSSGNRSAGRSSAGAGRSAGASAGAATPSCSAANPATKVSAGRRSSPEVDEVPDAGDVGDAGPEPVVEKEQPTELQDTAASIPNGSKASSGRPSISGRSPGSACTHVEKGKSGGEGSRSRDSGSSRTQGHGILPDGEL